MREVRVHGVQEEVISEPEPAAVYFLREEVYPAFDFRASEKTLGEEGDFETETLKMPSGDREPELLTPATANLAAFRDLSQTARWVFLIVILLLAFGPPVVIFAYIGEGFIAFIIALIPVVSFLVWWVEKKTSLTGGSRV